jgi:Flp pilus assembly protein TadG
MPGAETKPMTLVQPSSTGSRAVDSQRRASHAKLPIRSRGRLQRGQRFANRCGAAAVEFAIVAPVFFLLVIGMIEIGRALMVQQVLINASRVGARQAVTAGATTSAVQNAVKDYATSVAVPSVSVSVTPDPAAAKSGDTMTVTTSVNYNSVSWLASPWFLGGKTLTASSKMRKEGFD